MMPLAIQNRFPDSASHESSSRRTGALSDLMGAVTAGLCAVHCAVLGVGASVFAVAGGGLSDPWLRWSLVCIAALFTSHSLRSGRRVRDRRAVVALVGGLAALVLGRLVELPTTSVHMARVGEVVALLGGSALAFGHFAIFTSQRRTASRSPAGAVNLGVETPPQSRTVPRWATATTRSLLWITVAVALLYFFSGPRMLPASAMSAAANASSSDEDSTEVGWGLLAQLDPYSGERGPELSKVIDKRVRVPGYIVPLDEAGTEFLLAPWVGACIHAPTPPANQMVHVILKKGVTAIDPWGWEPLWVTGKLEIVESESPYGAVSYFMRGESTKIYEWDDSQ